MKTACIDDLVAERGLYASVEEGGKNFSGGEKQRIDIARALLQDTPILILDEATSALDNETQSRLISNLRATNKTIIFVAHRLSSINHCDQLFLLKDGQIIKHEIPH
jgi:ABC-type multidrug transport system fused ATPase/permease subunit